MQYSGTVSGNLQTTSRVLCRSGFQVSLVIELNERVKDLGVWSLLESCHYSTVLVELKY